MKKLKYVSSTVEAIKFDGTRESFDKIAKAVFDIQGPKAQVVGFIHGHDAPHEVGSMNVNGMVTLMPGHWLTFKRVEVADQFGVVEEDEFENHWVDLDEDEEKSLDS